MQGGLLHGVLAELNLASVVIRTSCASPLPAADRPLHRALSPFGLHPRLVTVRADLNPEGARSRHGRRKGRRRGDRQTRRANRVGYLAEHFGTFCPYRKKLALMLPESILPGRWQALGQRLSPSSSACLVLYSTGFFHLFFLINTPRVLRTGLPVVALQGGSFGRQHHKQTGIRAGRLGTTNPLAHQGLRLAAVLLRTISSISTQIDLRFTRGCVSRRRARPTSRRPTSCLTLVSALIRLRSFIKSP